VIFVTLYYGPRHAVQLYQSQANVVIITDTVNFQGMRLATFGLVNVLIFIYLIITI